MDNHINLTEFKAGVWKKQYQYNSFSPELINKLWHLDDPHFLSLVSEADRGIGELNAFSQLIPDIDFFIMMHKVREATASSRIEGTQTNIEEAFLKIEDIAPEKRDDWQEVQNYISAMNTAIDELKTLPLSNRLIKNTHRTLLEKARGEHKLPGEFRTSQNWIGGASLSDAAFIPPHYEEVPELMGDLEKFLHNDELHLPDLVRIAIAHYQFETIHPFLDGNGRIGRLLITLYLVSKKILVKPSFYLSAFFEKNKTLYYDNLMNVRTNNDMLQWLKFFMVGAIETAKNSIQTFKDIITLKEEIEGNVLMKLSKKAVKAKALLTELYKNPMTNTQNVSEILKVSIPTANSLINDLVQNKILTEWTGFKRNRIFVFERYVKLFP